MQPHEERVISEKHELDKKLEKLHEFCFIDRNNIFRKLSLEDRNLLQDQYKRIERFSK